MEKKESFLNEEWEYLSVEDKKKKLKEKFFEFCKKGNSEMIGVLVGFEELDIYETDDKKWTGIMYAIINNHVEVVNLILKKESTIQKPMDEEIIVETVSREVKDPFVKPLEAKSYGKYTPLHWAAYKGNIEITSLLLKYKHDPLQIDTGGNSALHQAAASNNIQLFKLLMGLGLDLEMKNSRNHSAIDLTSNPEIKKIIQKSLSVKICQICNKLFTFHNKRFLCGVNEEIICKECCNEEHLFKDVDAEEKNIIQRRCINCIKKISRAEAELNYAIKESELDNLKEVYNYILKDNINICCKLRRDAEIHIEKLEREKEIYDHIKSLKFVDNHKTIEKSVYLLEQMIIKAEERKINLEIDIIQNAYLEKNRLLAERDLRKLLSNLTIDQSSYENLNELNEKLNNARMCKVNEEYCSKASDLSQKIKVNLNAKELLELFSQYPIREYPVEEIIDPKKKKAPPKPPPKKKKKKEPPFIIPDWAKELKTLVEKTQELKGYLIQSHDIGLDSNFETKCKDQLIRFDQEIKFRRSEEEKLRLLEEEKKKKKTGKK